MVRETLLITGATGMIGFKTLILLLQQDKYSIRVAVRSQASFDTLVTNKIITPFVSQLKPVIVPDITLPGAYDDAVEGVTYVVHVASPLPNASTSDFEEDLIRPAIQGTVGIMESAYKTTGIKKIVITASIASIVDSEFIASGAVVTEQARSVNTTRPFANAAAAYGASKALAFQAADEFIADKKPGFIVVKLLPTFVIGRDETVPSAAQIVKGTNGLLMGPVLGHPAPYTRTGASVHVDDVAKLHVLALDPSINRNEDFLVSNPVSFEWADSFDIVKRRYPKEYAAGLFKFDSIPRPETRIAKLDTSKVTKAFGIEFKSFEEQVTSVVDHFLELAGAN